MSLGSIKSALICSAVILTSCATPPTPYPDLARDGNATLSFEGTRFNHFAFIPDGEKCHGAHTLSSSQNPLLRPDRELIVQSNKRSALLVVWLRGDFTSPPFSAGACHVILSFNLAQDGRYRLQTATRDDKCYADIVPLGSSAPPQVQQMKWDGFSIPSSCVPSKE